MNTVTSTAKTATASLFNQYRLYEAVISITNALLEYRSNERDLTLLECFFNSNNELTVTLEYTAIECNDDDDLTLMSVVEVYCFGYSDLINFDTSNITESKLWKHRRF
jgi:hypothetical protein